MSIVNAALNGLFDVLLFPFKGMHPLVGLTVLSLPVTAGMLWVFKRTSNQDKLAAIKDQITAGMFEIRLFNDDLGAIFRAQGQILAANGRYLGHSLVPLVWMIIPFVLVMGQLQFQYGFRGLTPGDEAVVTVTLQDGWAAAGTRPDVGIEAPTGLRIDTKPVWAPSVNEISWRIAAEEWGDYEIVLTAGGDTITKSVRVTDDVVRLAPKRVAPDFLEMLINPAEKPIPKGGAIEAITLSYMETAPMVMDLSLWVWLFVGLTIVMAFAIKKPMGVTI